MPDSIRQFEVIFRNAAIWLATRLPVPAKALALCAICKVVVRITRFAWHIPMRPPRCLWDVDRPMVAKLEASQWQTKLRFELRSTRGSNRR